MTLSPGDLVLDRYVIESMVGIGGMGAVYRAVHQKLGIAVAVKTITGEASPDLVARFGREAQLLARVRHPNVVSILDVGNTPDGSPCMVMEFLEGEALDARIERRGALPWSEVRTIGLYILQGLDAIHAAGIIHRDLKPANVLAARGTPEVIKLVDFGIAHSSAADAAKYTRTGALIGTPAYMSPEQLIGSNIDFSSDIYALALVLYELATGLLPFGGDPSAALRRLRDAVPTPIAPAPLPAIPEAGANALLQALQIEPERRPRTAKQYYALLHAARATPVTPAQTRANSAQPSQAAKPAAVAPPPRPRTGTAVPPRPPPTAASAVDPATFFDASVGPAQPTAMPMPTMLQPTAAARALVAARLPVSRMSRDEQKALALLAAPGRAYHLGGGLWFAVVPGANEQETKAAARRIGNSLQDRFGDTCKVVFTQASTQFALTPASLSGAAPLPDEINHLLEHLL